MQIRRSEYNKLIRLAYHDNLTHCYNRNWLFENFSNKSEFVLTFVDINNLKLINDTNGHHCGDELIKAVVKKIKKYGKVVRYGGDEFIIISKHKPPKDIDDKRYAYGYVVKTKKQTIKQAIKIADVNMYIIKEKIKTRSK